MNPRAITHLCRVSAFVPSRANFGASPKQDLRDKFAIARTRSPAPEAGALSGKDRGFTLIELLVVIAIIAILIGLLFPAFKAVQKQAQSTQAKNDLTQIVNAVNAFYTDYGKYPMSTGADTTYGSGSNPNSNILYVLRADPTAINGNPNANNAINTRQIVFINPPFVKNDIVGNRRSGISPTDGNYYGPWANQYQMMIDGNYDNSLANPYTPNTGAGPATLAQGVIAWSFGPDGVLGTTFSASDDVISWQ
jgi:prepilin-type N-terminal cleavage/methylation domain-containing protein